MQVIRNLIMLQQYNINYVHFFVIKISKVEKYWIFKQSYRSHS